MKKTFLFILSPAILLAGEIDLSFIKNNGESSYIVESPFQELKAKLYFPFEFSNANIMYKHDFENFELGVSSSFLIDSQTTIGKDLDWKADTLTVYSESKNNIDKYHQFSIKLAKNINKDLNIFSNIKHTTLNFNWNDTRQKDYVSNISSNLNGKTLTFEQNINQVNLGLSYRIDFNKIQLKLIPSFVYARIHNKDTHIVRDFYTIQNANAIGYSLQSKLRYKIDKNSSFLLLAEYEMFKDKSTDMDYYNKILGNYRTLPSSFEFKNRKFGLTYSYKF
ncbi:MAG: putative porin [Arcobacter sp.]|nr:putative porin [Arcobacter sp.]